MTEAGWTSRQIVYRELERMASIYPLTVGANKGSEGVTRLLESLIAKMDDSYQQGRVEELEEWQQIVAGTQDRQDLIYRLSDHLTQRTAERDTARRRVDELEAREVDVVLLRDDLEQRTAELEAANHTASTHQALWREACDQRDKAQAELERVRVLSSHNERRLAVIDKKYKELHGLVLALPKVERAVVVSNGYVKDSTRCHALFGADEDAASYAALLRARRGKDESR